MSGPVPGSALLGRPGSLVRLGVEDAEGKQQQADEKEGDAARQPRKQGEVHEEQLPGRRRGQSQPHRIHPPE